VNNDAIEPVIDEAARLVTAGAPSPALRARVLAQLGPQRPRLSSWALTASIAIPAVIVVLAVVWQPAERSRPEPGQTAAPQPAAATADERVRERATPRADVPEASRSRAAAGRRAPVIRLAIDQSALDALAPPPLKVPPMVLPGMAPTSIAVQPLGEIAPLAISPLEAEGDRR
jgi:hypothetical protein